MYEAVPQSTAISLKSEVFLVVLLVLLILLVLILLIILLVVILLVVLLIILSVVFHFCVPHINNFELSFITIMHKSLLIIY